MAKFRNEDLLLATNQKIWFGDSNEKHVSFDGTNLTISGGATIQTGVFGLSSGVTVNKILDEDNMVSDDASALATQQSIKAYVDGQIATISGGSFDHGNLQGLTNDDHTQYLLADGSRALTGTWGYGAQSISGTGNFYGTDITLTGDLTADTLNVSTCVASNLIPCASGTQDLGSADKPWDEIHAGAIRSTTSDNSGKLILGSSNSTAASYAEIYDGGSLKPGYIQMHSADGTSYYLAMTDSGGFYVDTNTPSGVGIASWTFSSTILGFGSNTISGTGDIHCGKIFGDIEDTNRKTGRYSIANNAKAITVAFASAYPTTNYTVTAALGNTGSPDPPSIYPFTIFNKTVNGFDVYFSGRMDSSDYELEWITVLD